MQLGIYKANVWNVATLGSSILPQSNTDSDSDSDDLKVLAV